MHNLVLVVVLFITGKLPGRKGWMRRDLLYCPKLS
jgi:hypothetical protein